MEAWGGEHPCASQGFCECESVKSWGVASTVRIMPQQGAQRMKARHKDGGIFWLGRTVSLVGGRQWRTHGIWA